MVKKNNWSIWVIIILVLLFGYFLITNQDTETQTQPQQVTPQATICSGFPDFSGTPRVGEPCETDWDCENHLPSGYISGDIKCLDNGKCQYSC